MKNTLVAPRSLWVATYSFSAYRISGLFYSIISVIIRCWLMAKVNTQSKSDRVRSMITFTDNLFINSSVLRNSRCLASKGTLVLSTNYSNWSMPSWLNRPPGLNSLLQRRIISEGISKSRLISLEDFPLLCSSTPINLKALSYDLFSLLFIVSKLRGLTHCPIKCSSNRRHHA